MDIIDALAATSGVLAIHWLDFQATGTITENKRVLYHVIITLNEMCIITYLGSDGAFVLCVPLHRKMKHRFLVLMLK